MTKFEPQECLNTVVRVYVPKQFLEPGDIGDNLVTACIAHAGGATLYHARGAWLDPNNSLCAEGVVIVEVLCSTDTAYDRVHTACMEYVQAAKAAGEQAVLITHQQVQGRIY